MFIMIMVIMVDEVLTWIQSEEARWIEVRTISLSGQRGNFIPYGQRIFYELIACSTATHSPLLQARDAKQTVW